MAESTITIKPFGKEFDEDSIRTAFKDFQVQRVHIARNISEATVEFASSAQVEALGTIYPDCQIPLLGNAEVGLVETGFAWPKVGTEEEGLIEIVDVAKECLVSIKDCSKVGELTEEEILGIFSKYAISKLARFEQTHEVIIEFQQSGDLQALEIDFDQLKVPQLGPNAFIDCGSEVDPDRFAQQYRLNKKSSFSSQTHLFQNQPVSDKQEPEKKLEEHCAPNEKVLGEEKQTLEKKEQKQRENIVEAEKKKKAEEEAKQQAEQERRNLQIQQLEKEKKQAEERQKRQAEEKQKQISEKQRRESEERERKEAEEKQRRETEEKQKRQALERQKQVEEKQKRQALERQKQAEEKQKRQTQDRQKKEAQERQKRQAQQSQKRQAEEREKQVLRREKEVGGGKEDSHLTGLTSVGSEWGYVEKVPGNFIWLVLLAWTYFVVTL